MTRRGLIPQLFAVTVLPLTILVFVMTFGSILVHQRAMRTLVGERDERAVRTLAAALGTELDHRLSSLDSLALRAAQAGPHGLDEVLESAGTLSSDFDAGLAFFDRGGTLLVASGERAFWESLGVDSGKKPITAESLAVEGGVILPAFQHPIHGKPVVLAASQASSPAAGNGLAAVGAFYPETLAGELLAHAFDSHSQTAILIADANGQALYLSDAGGFHGLSEGHPGVEEALAGKSGTSYMKVNGDEHVIAYSPVPRVGWALVIEESWEMVASPMLDTSLVAPLTLVPVLLIALAALWFVARQVLRPLQRLEAQAAEMSWGNYAAIEKSTGGIAEIRHLQAELIHMAQKVSAAQESLHGYIGAMTTGQEEERRRLARDLHDDTLQSLIALKQRIQLARLAQNDGPGEMLTELENLAEGTIDNLRRVTRALRPIYLEDLGLVTALEMLAQETARNIGIPVDFHRVGAERRLNATIELALYRIVQEALSNTARHAEATQAAITLAFAPQEVRLEITDNGQGFEVPNSPAEFAPGGHYGLLGIFERAELIGADLKIQSAPGKGIRLAVRLAE
jgi:two-component system sensor histidine kinase UhpB